MICVEIRPRYGASEVVSLNSEKDSFETRDFGDFIEEFFRISEEKSDLMGRDQRFYDSLHFIEDDYSETVFKSCRRIVCGIEEENRNISLREWASKIVGELSSISHTIEKIIVVIENEEEESADIEIYEYKDKTDINREGTSSYDVTEYKGVEKARGYDVKSEVETERDLSLFYDWEKWNKVKVSNKI